jgi:hypothetical protein
LLRGLEILWIKVKLDLLWNEEVTIEPKPLLINA